MSPLCLLTIVTAEMLLGAPSLPRPDRPPHGPIVVPIVGQPGNFNGAVGTKFQVATRVSRNELTVGQWLTLTVRVTAVGRYSQPPERPALDQLPRVTERFKVRQPARLQADRVLADQRAWEYDYELSPLRASVERVPPLAFVWYRPNRNPNLRGFFPTTFADSIDIKVKPVPVLTPSVVKQVPIVAPESFFVLASGPEVERNEELFGWPSSACLLLLLCVPPVAAVTWYGLWRRLYPDAAQLARRRQSRAATEALHALGSLAPASDASRVGPITSIAVHYLRDRFQLRSVEPTPAEVVDLLQRAGAPPVLAAKAAEFFRACDAARFAPASATATDRAARPDDGLAAAAQQLIHSLEDESW